MIEAELISILGAESVLRQQPLSQYTSFRVGGAAEYLVLPRDYRGLAQLVNYCFKHNIPWWVLGRGTNLLISDKGLPGVVVALGDNLAQINVNGTTIIAQAGASLSRVCAAALANNLAGLEFAEGIPGSVGGAVTMNAGAYGGEMKDVLRQALAANCRGELVTFSAQEMELGYRSSVFQHNRHVVLEVKLALTPGNAKEIHSKMNEFTRSRRAKQPLDKASAGSTFRRPPGHYAGQLIESCRLKGATVGGAAVSDKHCGFIVNTNGATAQDIFNLIRLVQAEVRKQHAVQLVPEVKIWGEFDQGDEKE